MTTSRRRHLSSRALTCVPGLAGICTMAWAAPGDSGNPVVAKGGSVELGVSDVRVSALPESTRGALPTSLPALDQRVRNELLRRSIACQVKATGFEEKPDIARTLQQVREEAVLRLWVTDHAAVPAS